MNLSADVEQGEWAGKAGELVGDHGGERLLVDEEVVHVSLDFVDVVLDCERVDFDTELGGEAHEW